MDKTILHCDLNNFYASVECLFHPELEGKPVAVAGDVEKRTGIILAKNQIAKKAGVKTGEPVWSAVGKCHDLVTIKPDFKKYNYYSRLVRDIYERYTDEVEAFGIDECWIDVTGSKLLFGDGMKIAEEIRQSVKDELKLTISIGVSFNKIFAKLGSDMKKPDAITEITKENYKEKVWPLPVSDLLFIGPATTRKLQAMGISTIGQLANADLEILLDRFGKNGRLIYYYANGWDMSLVHKTYYKEEPKTIGNSMTLPFNIESKEDIWKNLFLIADNVCARLRGLKLYAGGVSVFLKDDKLQVYEFEEILKEKTFSTDIVAKCAFDICKKNWSFDTPVRALGLRVYNLIHETCFNQLDFTGDALKKLKFETIDKSVDLVRERYGNESIDRARLLHYNIRDFGDSQNGHGIFGTIPR